MSLDVTDDETLPAIAITRRSGLRTGPAYVREGRSPRRWCSRPRRFRTCGTRSSSPRTGACPWPSAAAGIGASTNDGGIVLDLGRLRRVQVLDSGAVRVESGARWGEVARTLDPYDLALTSGDTGDVGVGGRRDRWRRRPLRPPAGSDDRSHQGRRGRVGRRHARARRRSAPPGPPVGGPGRRRRLRGRGRVRVPGRPDRARHRGRADLRHVRPRRPLQTLGRARRGLIA